MSTSDMGRMTRSDAVVVALTLVNGNRSDARDLIRMSSDPAQAVTLVAEALTHQCGQPADEAIYNLVRLMEPDA